MANVFVNECEKLLGSNPYLWMDISATAHHYIHSKEDFRWRVNKMRNSKACIVTFPHYSIYSSTTLKSNDSEESRGYLPNTLIPIEKDTLDQNYEKIFQEATKNAEINVILINDETCFDVKQIVKALNKMGVRDDDIFVHTFSSTKSFEEVKKFLESPTKYLICSDELFSGMTTDSISYCFSDKDEHSRTVYMDHIFSKYHNSSFIYKY